MGVKTGPALDNKDTYINYDYEDVMFHRTPDGKIYRKFYNNPESKEPIDHKNRLFNDALLYGEEITKEQYQAR